MRGSFFCSPIDNKIFVSINTNLFFFKKKYVKNYKPKSKLIIEEITSEISTSSTPNVEAHIVDKILSHSRTNVNSPSPRIVLQ